ncbi:MAG: bifunctional 5,10-methylenetetrahydrofolate dehydrogenase/5,10-methenyltetrahydrofolate cyclohydrolase [Verrucomicrobia bacterium]|nr:bifunctional 5,10-methylenetetrahydrofolate dehydrogenase/5,10-methenyltetrahydrofolate cyclohydrolase [Verrucomicrobiota bacterium]
MHNLIDGKAIASQIHKETADQVEKLKSRGIHPGLVFVRVGEDPASRAYVGMKEKMAEELGIASRTLVLDSSTSQQQLLDLIDGLNHDSSVHGILVQAPLPSHIDERVVFSMVSPRKDVDGFHPVNVGRLMLGDAECFRPCTPAGVHELLKRSHVPLDGANVVILGRGNIVGKPMASILMQKAPDANATVTVLHSRSRDITSHCLRADIIIAAIGSPHFLKADMVKSGAVIVDVGVNRIEDPSSKRGYRLVGDVDFHLIQPIAGRITPNPGGVGPMTIAMLMHNTARAAHQMH